MAREAPRVADLIHMHNNATRVTSIVLYSLPPLTMSVDEFVETASRMNSAWRVAVITSSAVDMVLYVAVIGQTIRYFYTRPNDTKSVVAQRIVNTSGLEVKSDGEGGRCLRQRPWDWLVILVVA